MKHKISYLAIAIVVVGGLLLPATASAANDPQLTSGGTLVSAGSGWWLTIFVFSFGDTSGNELVKCSSGQLGGKVLKNSGSTLEGEVSSAAISGTGALSAHNNLNECTGSFGNSYVTFSQPMCVRSTPTMAEDEFQITGGNCTSGGNVKFTVGSTTAGACEYESTSSVKGDYTTGGTEASLTVRKTTAGSGSKLIKGGFLCPSSEIIILVLILETNNGTKLTIS
ncbi:MAG TPA: hypothetical protein VGK66_02265 [Solirubrobacterales bacterium]|nr:hypothetical protein [Solirubrobacterales bacterium]